MPSPSQSSLSKNGGCSATTPLLSQAKLSSPPHSSLSVASLLSPTTDLSSQPCVPTSANSISSNANSNDIATSSNELTSPDKTPSPRSAAEANVVGKNKKVWEIVNLHDYMWMPFFVVFKLIFSFFCLLINFCLGMALVLWWHEKNGCFSCCSWLIFCPPFLYLECCDFPRLLLFYVRGGNGNVTFFHAVLHSVVQYRTSDIFINGLDFCSFLTVSSTGDLGLFSSQVDPVSDLPFAPLLDRASWADQ